MHPDDLDDTEAELRWLPIFPLPLVLFPGMEAQLHIFEPRYQQMMADILEGDSGLGDGDGEFGITLYLESVMENVGVTTAIGTVAHVCAVERLDEGKMNIEVQGTERFKIVKVDAESKPYLMGQVEPYRNDENDSPLPALVDEVIRLFREMVRLSYKVQGTQKTLDEDLSGVDPEVLSYAIGEYLSHDLTLQQVLLEMNSTTERLRHEKDQLEKIASRLAAMASINAAFGENADEPHGE